jgi:hypothetical protein
MEFRIRAANTTRADPVPYEDRLSHREGIVTISEKKVKTDPKKVGGVVTPS